MSDQSQPGRPARRFRHFYVALAALTAAFTALIASPVFTPAGAATTASTLSFSNTPFIRPEGGSEPEISIGPSGTMGIVSLQWLFNPSYFGTHLWMGPFGSTPTFEGLVDAGLQEPAKQVFGSDDADVDMGSTGTMHITTLIALVNPTSTNAQLGVTAITCPNASPETFSISGCTRQIIGTTNSDRPWITSEGKHVYISYHDPNQATLPVVQRSDDDGYTWQRVGNPIVGQGGATGDATFNNVAGPIVADPSSHNVYSIYAAGEPGIQKATTIDFNNIYVSRSTDLGKSWTTNLVYHAPLFTKLDNFWPALAVDPTNGKLYAAWSDGQHVGFSTSSDHGSTWSPAVTVNTAPANTAVEPWLAAYNGTVDLVYYATDSSNDSTAAWNVYLAQTTNDGTSFTQSKVSNTPNHHGVLCTSGTACPPGTRHLLDDFQVAINPLNGLAAVVYTDDTLTTTTVRCLPGQTVCGEPQLVLAQQK